MKTGSSSGDLRRSVSQYYLDQIRNSTRSFFLSRVPGRQRLVTVVTVAIVGFWILDAALRTIFFDRRAFWDVFLFAVPAEALYVRLLVSVLLGVLAYVLVQIDHARELERALEKSTRWFSTTLKGIGAAIVATDKYGDVIFMNTDALLLTGWPLEQAIGKPLEEICPLVAIESIGTQPLPLGHKVREDSSYALPSDCHIQAATGLSVPVGGSLAPIRARAGDLLGAVLVLHDLSAYRNLEESRRQLAAAVMQAPDAVIMTDAAGQIMYVNPAFTTLTGLDRETVVGEPAARFADRVGGTEVTEGLSTALAAGRTWRGALALTRGDDGAREIQAVVSPVTRVDGKVTHYVCLVRDVSRESELQQQLLQAQKMEVVGRLAAGVAHDFNNVLAVIGGYAGFIAMVEGLDEETLDAAEQIDAAVERASALTRQLLAFSRRDVSRPRDIEVNAVMRGMHKMLERLVGDRVELVTELAEQPLPTHADPGRLEQVVINLVVNARDAMPDGGTITLTTRRAATAEMGLDAAAFGAEQAVVIAVADNGCGIPAELHEQVFEAFFTTKGKGKGTGLGLSVVRDIVTETGGTIKLDSTPGTGTTFTICLPLGSRVEHQEEPADWLAMGPTGTILVVDDERSVRAMAAATLRHAGCTVVEAENGAAAGQRFAAAAGTIDLVLSDVVMPHVSGIELARQLRQRDALLPIVLMTAHMDDDLDAQLAELPGVRLIMKPFQARELLHEVAVALHDRAEPDT